MHMLPDIIDGVGTSVDILDSMSHVPSPSNWRPSTPPPRAPTPPSTAAPSRPFSPLAARRSAGALHHSVVSKRTSSLGSTVVPRPPPRSHRKGRLHVLAGFTSYVLIWCSRTRMQTCLCNVFTHSC